jgi:DNA polymerase-3 subunit gamma/tau
MENTKINLSRKWRSSTFDGVIGQDLSLKMLKNSLYAGLYFPVYLFAGQRGCGKTTTARVFAAALNCRKLPLFQQVPTSACIPCGTCDSCAAMATGKHPDFIEIDAASNTGVDNIRNVIEAATLLPLMGCKKIYLIDEAHMLSRAAFNALLKILEEPPQTTLFILATTDQDKILDTVRSRCFKLFFNAIASDALVALLERVCVAESIPYEVEGLRHIADHAQGSARDALNTLEQVRFAKDVVDKNAVLQALGHIDDVCLIALLQEVYQGNVQQFLLLWRTYGMDHASVTVVWHRLVVLSRILIWTRHGVTTLDIAPTAQLHTVSMSLPFLSSLMEGLYRAEQYFLHSALPHGMLETVLLQLCIEQQKGRIVQGDATDTRAAIAHVSVNNSAVVETHTVENKPQKELVLWDIVLERLIANKDPHIHSILSQASVREHHAERKTMVLEFPEHLSFFSDILVSTKPSWYAAVSAVYGDVVVDICFVKGKISDENSHEVKSRPSVKITAVKELQKQKEHINLKTSSMTRQRVTSTAVRGVPIDVADSKKWPKTAMVLAAFPGTVRMLKEVQS